MQSFFFISPTSKIIVNVVLGKPRTTVWVFFVENLNFWSLKKLPKRKWTKLIEFQCKIVNHFYIDEVSEGGEVGRALQLWQEQKFLNIWGKSWFGKKLVCIKDGLGRSRFGKSLVGKSWFGRLNLEHLGNYPSRVTSCELTVEENINLSWYKNVFKKVVS